MATAPALTSRMKRTDSFANDGTSPGEYSKKLAPFQIEKLTYMFNALYDLDKNDLIEEADIYALTDKMRDYCGWGKDSSEYKEVLDVQKVFLECLTDQAKAEQAANAQDKVIETWGEALKTKDLEVTSMTLGQWLNMWGRLCYGSAGLGDFPIWVQMLPGIFFKVIDQDRDGILSQDEIRKFYDGFVGISSQNLDKVTKEGFRAMTAGGDYKLTPENFSFCFANFLLGRSIYGPGKYIFGVFDNRDIDESYKVIYNEEDQEE